MKHYVDGAEFVFSTRIPLHAEKSFQYLLLRLLLGPCELASNGRPVSQSKDFSFVPPVAQALQPSAAVSAFLGTSVGVSARKFIRVTTLDNRRFYQDLVSEFASYFVSRTLGAHTTSFVYMYRVMERLYFSVPLLYCSTMQDYAGTFADLKALFEGEKAGEHGLFKKFLNNGKLVDAVVLDTTYRLSFSSNGANARRHYELAHRLFDGFVSADPATTELEIKYRDVPEFLRNLRNRFFHFRAGDGQKNISLSELHDAEAFFAVVNAPFCSCLASIVLHSMSKKYQT